MYWRGGGKGRRGRRRATYAHETLEGTRLSAGLVPFETLEPVVAPEVGEVEGKELLAGEQGGERGLGTDQGGEDGPEKIASRGTAGHWARREGRRCLGVNYMARLDLFVASPRIEVGARHADPRSARVRWHLAYCDHHRLPKLFSETRTSLHCCFNPQLPHQKLPFAL